MNSYAKRKIKCSQLNICFICSNPKEEHNKRLCSRCSKKERDRSRSKAARLRLKHKKANNCITCGKPPLPNKSTCQNCSNRASKSTMSRYNTNKKNGVCPFCGEASKRFRCDICHTKHLKHTKQQWNKDRLLILEHYGNKCVCCGESTYEFLEIDHINGGGTKHRLITGRHVYKWIIKNNFPKDLQVLCANCNRCDGKFGICDHKQSISADKKQRSKRLDVINRYGGKCVYCGESRWPFLEFDHINNNGNKHRKVLKGSILNWIVNNNYPNTIQLLCCNCNKAKGFYKLSLGLSFTL